MALWQGFLFGEAWGRGKPSKEFFFSLVERTELLKKGKMPRFYAIYYMVAVLALHFCVPDNCGGTLDLQ